METGLSCLRLHFRAAFLGVEFFALFLADDATLRGRIGHQPGKRDRIPAVDADAIFAIPDALQGGLDIPHPVNMAIEQGQVEIRQRIGQRFVAAVARFAVEQVDAMLVARVLQFLAYFAHECLIVFPQFPGELIELGWAEYGHLTSCIYGLNQRSAYLKDSNIPFNWRPTDGNAWIFQVACRFWMKARASVADNGLLNR